MAVTVKIPAQLRDADRQRGRDRGRGRLGRRGARGALRALRRAARPHHRERRAAPLRERLRRRRGHPLRPGPRHAGRATATRSRSCPPSPVGDAAVVTAVSRSDDARPADKANQAAHPPAGRRGVEGDVHSGSHGPASLARRARCRAAEPAPGAPDPRRAARRAARRDGFDVAAGQMGENVTTRGVDLLGLPTGARAAPRRRGGGGGHRPAQPVQAAATGSSRA